MKVHEGIDSALLNVSSTELYEYIENFSLHYIKGDESRKPIFISVLLHGNEFSGLMVIQKLLKKYKNLRRSIYLHFGNIEAAQKGLRHLAHQPDFNRIWMGGGAPECAKALEVLEFFKKKELFVAIDIHNNTGKSPDYACVNHLDEPFLRLAQLFSPTIIYFTRPFEVLSNAFSEMCPSVTLECGIPGSPTGIESALKLIEYCMNIDILPTNVSVESELFHSFARINIPSENSIGFGDEDCDFVFPLEIEDNNFSPYHKGEYFCRRKSQEDFFVVTNSDGAEITSEFFDFEGYEVRIKKEFTPSMFTRNKKVIYQDCLGYIMKHYER